MDDDDDVTEDGCDVEIELPGFLLSVGGGITGNIFGKQA